MKIKNLLILGVLMLMIISCRKDPNHDQLITNLEAVKSKLESAGFNTTEGFYEIEDGYIVEHDIFFSKNDINNLDSKLKDKVQISYLSKENNGSNGDRTSHYLSNDLVIAGSSVTRNISVYIDPYFGSYLQQCLDSAIARYNALDLSINFSHSTSSNADIVISPVTDVDYLMRAGFPTYGNPHNQILANTHYFNASTTRSDAISVIAHEIGHCIGFRHADYMNRSFSCGIWPDNVEGTSPVGANYIGGTSSTPLNNSWMLACSNNYDRPFIPDDVLALKGTYPKLRNVYIKEIKTRLSDESYTIGCCDDRIFMTENVRIEFYQDQNLTIPYTTVNNFVIRVNDYSGNSFTRKVMFVPNGVNNLDLGTFTTDIMYSYGNEVSNDSNGLVISPFGAYHLAN